VAEIYLDVCRRKSQWRTSENEHDKTWSEVYKRMKDEGWTHIRGTGLVNCYYLHPTCRGMTTKGLRRDKIEGTHYFTSTEALREYAMKNRRWQSGLEETHNGSDLEIEINQERGAGGDDGSNRGMTRSNGGRSGCVENTADSHGLNNNATFDPPVYAPSLSFAPDHLDDDLGYDDGGPAGSRVMHVENVIDSDTAEAPGAANVPMGVKELLPLWSRIKEKWKHANCSHERKFYGHMKYYLSSQSKHALPSDVKQIEAFLSDFEATMKELDDRGNDYDAICNYEGWIEFIIEEAKKCLSPTSFHMAQHATNPIAGVKELRPLWNQIRGKLADAVCQYERTFYGHLKLYLSRQSKQKHGRVPLSDLDRINECLDEFETTLKRLNDRENDYDELRFYESLIKDVIKTWKGNLSLVE
jgi:hypothetical protein